ncbi:MAG: hypothetical protein IKN36_05475, partial [Clostridia bacterium]|nr:hypothetical protein [Clostridia bacterium]
VFSCRCGVKWVNDLYLSGRKIVGILCQKVGAFVLVGVGINVEKPRMIPADLADRFGYLVDSCQEGDGTRLVLRLSEELKRAYAEDRFSILSEYRARCIHVGSPVAVETDAVRHTGRCVGIADDFSLLVEENGAVSPYSSGMMMIL